MAVAHKQTTQRVLVSVRRRYRPWPRFGPTVRWTLAAFVAFSLYRSMPAEPDAALRTTVGQYLGFEYSKSRTATMQGSARHDGDALLDMADDVLNAHVEIDAIAVRGPILPAPLPRNAVVHVRYRVLKGRDLVEAKDRYLAFGKSLTTDWHFAGERTPMLYWIFPS